MSVHELESLFLAFRQLRNPARHQPVPGVLTIFHSSLPLRHLQLLELLEQLVVRKLLVSRHIQVTRLDDLRVLRVGHVFDDFSPPIESFGASDDLLDLLSARNGLERTHLAELLLLLFEHKAALIVDRAHLEVVEIPSQVALENAL